MSRIEDYALVGDTQTAALISKSGSIDWAPFPRFDSDSCFAALLGNRDHGRWSIAPLAPVTTVRRRYRPGTLVLETEMETADGVVRIIDFMPVRDHAPDLVRIVEGVRGQVVMRFDLVIRFDSGRVVPWVRRQGQTDHESGDGAGVSDPGGALIAIAGPNALCLRSDLRLQGEGLATVADFTIAAGERRATVCTWFPSHESLPVPVDPQVALRETEEWWRAWSDRCEYRGPWRDAVVTSLMVLKALTYGPTGGIVAAPTTSLPEWPGGARNWDYRYCWLRDSTLTLYAFMLTGYKEEAAAWREWLLRAAAGDPGQLQIMYGVSGERRLTEYEADWLPGYEGSRPVRFGNQAHQQLQLDVYGELVDTLYQAHRFGINGDPWAWGLQRALLDSLETRWPQDDHGIWEVRGPRRSFTHSKVMAWVAFDRAIKSVEGFQLEGPVARWRAIRDQIHAEVCARGFDRTRNAFTQSYGSPALDASLLMVPLVGFLPASDPRVIGTVAAIERELMDQGFVRRYQTNPGSTNGAASGPEMVDGLPPGEGVFLPCTFWLVDNYVQMGRLAEAKELFERVLAVRNDLGLLSEEYDPRARRLLGNFPQAFTHLGLVVSAHNLAGHSASPAARRSEPAG
jgi:GH15 family glucan-1,4-alpha-glucosidase